MKNIFFTVISLILCILLTSCAVNNALLYEDSFDELDISGRFNELAYSVERGKTSFLLYRQAETIIEDLESIMPEEDETLKSINKDFIVVARTLVQAMDHKKANNTLAFSSCYIAAKELYNITNKKLNQYKKTDWSTADEE